MLKAAEHTSKISADNSPAYEFNKMSSSSAAALGDDQPDESMSDESPFVRQ